MSWEQVVIGVMMVLGLVYNLVKWCRDLNNSSGEVVCMLGVYLVLQGGYAYILHCGGFW